jgi:DNA invertase Pin-like site-specific DNA recombinase
VGGVTAPAAARAPVGAAAPPGRTSLYRYSVLRGVPQSYLRHPLARGVLAPALDAQGRLDTALADRLLVAATRPGSKLGQAVRRAVRAHATAAEDAPVSPAPAAERPPRPQRRWQAKPLPDPDADLPEAVRQAQDHLRRRDFAVVRQPDGRFKVEGQLVTAAELVARSAAMHEREERRRARRLGQAQAAVPSDRSLPPPPAATILAGPASAGTGRGQVLGYARGGGGAGDVAGQVQRLRQAGAREVFTDHAGDGPDRPGLAALLTLARRRDTLAVVELDRLGRSLPELVATVAALEERGLALVSLAEGIDTAAATGTLFGTIARFTHRLQAERTRTGLAAARARGQRLGRKPLAQEKAAAMALVAAGVSPSAAARQVGLGRSTVYREVSRTGIERRA